MNGIIKYEKSMYEKKSAKISTSDSIVINTPHNTAIIEAYSDTGNSNGEIPKKDPLFALVLLYS